MTEIRDASKSDSRFVAWTILTAMGLGEELVPQMEEITRRDDTLYSWKRARVAVVDGEVAGCLISYPGEDYPLLRDMTWRSFRPFRGDELADFEPETFPGEYYLDSLAVLPEYRGNDLGRMLLLDGVDKARSMGYSRVTLIGESDHPHLLEYYRSIGFSEFGEILFFGNLYKRMEKVL